MSQCILGLVTGANVLVRGCETIKTSFPNFFILLKQMNTLKAFKTALNMSFISMITMEIVMNITDFFITGGAILNLFVIPIMLFFGFLSAWPYNYWQLKKYNISCH